MQIGSSSPPSSLGASRASQSSALSSPSVREQAERGPENDNDGDDQKAAAVSPASQAGVLASSGRGQRVNLLA